MHIYFSGIGGSGASSIAMLAKEAGYLVSGSDMADSSYIDYLKDHGISDISLGQDLEQISKIHNDSPIDRFVYTSALPAGHPELEFARTHGIRVLKHNEFLDEFMKQKNLELIAVAGTHGKSTTTSMVIWLLSRMNVPISYCVGAKLEFAELGHYDPASRYFVYEADEYDRKFLSFYPHLSLISGLDWDHPDIYPTRESYDDAFREFLDQSEQASLWHDEAERLGLNAEPKYKLLDRANPRIDTIKLKGAVNRQNAWLVAQSISTLIDKPVDELIKVLESFPGVVRRFEELAPNIYTDYAHTPPKIRGALQQAHEVAAKNVVVVYEGLHNLRQHFIKDELADLFNDVSRVYVVPSYLARENPDQKILTPEDLVNLLSPASRQHAKTAALDENLLKAIKSHAAAGDLVLALSAGGAGSLDEWLRANLA